MLSAPFAMGGYQAAMLKIPNNHNGYFMFLSPFTWHTWTACFITWFLYACILFLISHLNKKVNLSLKVVNESSFSFLQCVGHFSLGSLHYGVERLPPMLSGKVLQSYWSMLMLILVSVYTANLAAILSTNYDEKPFWSIHDIVHSGIKIYATKIEEPILRKVPLISQLIRSNQVYFEEEMINMRDNRTEMVELIKNNLNDGSILLNLDSFIEEIMKDIPSLYKLEGYFSYSGFSFAVRNDWIWADHLKRQFVQYSTSGYFYQLLKKYDQRESEEANSIKKIPFKNLGGVFGIVIMGGISAALFEIGNYFLKRNVVKGQVRVHEVSQPSLDSLV